MSEEEYEEAVDAVSEYLYLDTATAANRFFRACRAGEPEPAGTHHADTALRSFGVYQHGGTRDHVVARAVEDLCCRVVERWGTGTCLAEGKTSDQSIATVSQSADDSRHPVYSRLRVEAEELAVSWSLDVDELVQQASEMMEQELGESVDDFVEKLLEELTSPRAISSQKDGAGRIENVVQRLDSLLGARRDGMDASAHNPAAWEDALAARHQKRALECARAICDWVTSQVDGEARRIQGAQ